MEAFLFIFVVVLLIFVGVVESVGTSFSEN
jgi:hypothetical protein